MLQGVVSFEALLWAEVLCGVFGLFKVVSWSRFSRILGLGSFLHKASVFRAPEGANLSSQLLGQERVRLHSLQSPSLSRSFCRERTVLERAPGVLNIIT